MEEPSLQKSFDLFDCDGDGYLTLNEFTMLVRVLGVVNETSVITEQYNTISKLRGINYEMFQVCLKKLKEDSFKIEEVKSAVTIIDQKAKGLFSASELRRILTTMGDKLTDSEVTNIFSYMGIDEKGVVRMDDFVNQLESVYH
ncbi:calmodulin, putative [Entamoeba invadens IP1]|uniref:Calmodulin, putative n=1 Tax=Entamoeba invadens IP1 TaxID=370355 RepID=A0A0A1TU22_ENTIV|nr:calmodulin, putative [Entamoeba invadens IP1]ELP83417.1 calmodulin, putative [Entamoeba invadens IP1]|eukprot:XP_004182763.1 calmodulin, putative [Entamoeba invadens IP1]